MHGIGWLLVVASVVGPASVPAGSGAPAPLVALRPLGERAARVLERGLAQSASFRTLVAAAGGARTVVYVALDPQLAIGLRGVTRLMRVSTGERMMLIVLSPRACDDDVVAVLGHELQHVAEMAEAGVTTMAEVEAHYRKHGIAGSAGRFETMAAWEAGTRVRSELASAPGK